MSMQTATVDSPEGQRLINGFDSDMELSCSGDGWAGSFSLAVDRTLRDITAEAPWTSCIIAENDDGSHYVYVGPVAESDGSTVIFADGHRIDIETIRRVRI